MLRETFVNRAEGREWEDLSFELDENKFRHYISTMIGVNYDLTIEEMSSLLLFDNEKYLEMLFLFIDAHEMVGMIKKGAEEANGTINPTEVPQDGKDIASGGTDSLSQD